MEFDNTEDKLVCEICGKINSNKVKCHKKTYVLCIDCKYVFCNNICNKISNSSSINYTYFKKKMYTFKKSYSDSNSYDLDIEKILLTAFEKSVVDIKYNVPFSNITILNKNGEFYTYTSMDKIDRWLAKNLIEKIDDETYRFTHDVAQRYPIELRQDLKKDNKCVCCGSNLFLKKINVLPQEFKMNISSEYKDIIIIHFIFAVCIECKNFCLSVRNSMDDYYVDTYGKGFFAYLEGVINSANNTKIRDTIHEYLSIYKDKLK